MTTLDRIITTLAIVALTAAVCTLFVDNIIQRRQILEFKTRIEALETKP